MSTKDWQMIFHAETVASARAKARDAKAVDAEQRAHEARLRLDEDAVTHLSNRYTENIAPAVNGSITLAILGALDALVAMAVGFAAMLADMPLSTSGTTAALVATIGLVVATPAALMLVDPRYSRGQRPWFWLAPSISTIGAGVIVAEIVSLLVAIAAVLGLVTMGWLSTVIARSRWQFHEDLIAKDVAEHRLRNTMRRASGRSAKNASRPETAVKENGDAAASASGIVSRAQPLPSARVNGGVE